MSIRRVIEAFRRDGRGNVAIIVALVFVPILVIAGGATDLARYETFRVALQDGIDRGVLAAASPSQSKESEETVRDYIKTLSFIEEVALTVDPKMEGNVKTVSARARYDMPTAFLPLVGIKTLPVGAAATASSGLQNVEISLMLDFSGSMIGSRFKNLKPAAKEFIDTILTDESKDYTTISVVPYAGQVNPGYDMFNELVNLDEHPERRQHENSSCFEMTDDAAYADGLLDFSQRAQVPHFTKYNANNFAQFVNPGWCPSEDTSIVYLSNDRDYLKARIDGYQMYDGTGTAIAVNWGYMLLDPSAGPLIDTAINEGQVLPEFANRPAAFSDAETVKFIVLMTDGLITEQNTARDPKADVRTENNWKTTTSSGTNRDWMYDVCDAAKANGVTVFTIGFEVGGTGQQEMRNCATSPSHFYAASGLDIGEVFQKIATTMQKVKLTK